MRDKRSRSFYGADERLRYFNERDVRVSGSSSQLEGVWEEYRYDPLGRRVLVNTRTMNLCNSSNAFQCASATTRMVWAGDQLLWEIRIARAGEEISSLRLSQDGAMDLLKGSLRRMSLEYGDETTINGTKYLLSGTPPNREGIIRAMAVSRDGVVSSADLKQIRDGVFEVVR